MAKTILPPKNPLLPEVKLTLAEQKALTFFDRVLDEEWEIYVHPHLNGTNPNIVLLHPRRVIGVFEVREWNDAELSSLENDDLRCTLGKLRNIKDEIFDLYCPSLGMKASSVKSAKSVIHCYVICPFATNDNVAKAVIPLLAEKEKKYNAISFWGREALYNARSNVFFWSKGFMNAEAAHTLRTWLDGRTLKLGTEGLPLDEMQKKIVNTRTKSGYRRIKGVAGSGKTKVLAAKAAALANEGKRVLVVPFNMTLVSLLTLSIAQGLLRLENINFITALHFHGWCKRICRNYNYDNYKKIFENSSIKREEKLEKLIPELTLKCIQQSGDKEQIYDAVLVDEGQDFRLEWWNLLCQVCKPSGERILAADMNQDLYGNASAWTEEAMHNAGFRGQWAELSFSYRLPDHLLSITRHFAQKFLPPRDDIPKVSDQHEFSNNDSFRWIQCCPEDAVRVCCAAMLHMIMDCSGFRGGIERADVTFLAQTNEIGREVVRQLNVLGLKSEDTFAQENEKAKRAKQRFGNKIYSFKATTIHSFKGWETSRMVLYLDKMQSVSDRTAVYVALTRLSKDNANGSRITVVCAEPGLKNFGKEEFGAYYRDANADIGAFIANFLAWHFFAFRNVLPNMYGDFLCTLRSFAFRDSFPNYKDPRHRNFYFLKYASAYLIEYYEIYRRLLTSDWLQDSPRLSVLSIGCGAMLDLVGLKYALRACKNSAEPVYRGVDLVDWKCDDTKVIQNQRLLICDIGAFSPQPEENAAPYSVLFFPKSISEIPQDSLDAFVDALSPSFLTDRAALVVSKRGQAREDHEAGLRLCQRLCKRLGFDMWQGASVFSSESSPIKFADLLPCADSREQVEYYLGLSATKLEVLSSRFTDCNCPKKKQCEAIVGKYPMLNLVRQEGGLNADPEIYYLQKRSPHGMGKS